jgi:hypothetical protein
MSGGLWERVVAAYGQKADAKPLCPNCPRWKVSNGSTRHLSQLEKLKDALLAQIQEVRCIRMEIQKQAGNGSLEPWLGAEQVAQILGVDVGHVHA